MLDRTLQLGISPIGDNDLEAADFNGDGRLDIAQLSNSRLRISFQNASGTFVQGFQLDIVNGGTKMAVGDVDGDGAADIYVGRRTSGNSGHLMLVNDGSGISFQAVAIPQPGTGSFDDVLPIDYDGNGHTDFITLNGWYTFGPVRLTAFFVE
jgi:hypothetical protein